MEPENELAPAVSLQEYLLILRRRRAIILQAFVLISVVGLVVTLMTRPVYHATAKLLVEGPAYNMSLTDTSKAHLLPPAPARPAAPEAVTRRAVLRKLALAGGLTVLLPVVQTIVAPTPAMAASTLCTKNGDIPTPLRPCCSGKPTNPAGRCRS